MANLRLLAMTVFMPVLAAAVPAAGEPGTCLVEQNFYYPADGMAERALAVRVRAEEVRARLGLPTGRVMIVEKASSGHPSNGKVEPLDMSYITSLTEFASENEAASVKQALAASEEYRAILSEMGGLLRHFETAIWRPVTGGCKGEVK